MSPRPAPTPPPRPTPPPPAPRPPAGPGTPSRPVGPRIPFTVATLSVSALSIAAGLALIVAPLRSTVMGWNMPTGYTADLLLVPLAVVWALLTFLTPGRPCSAETVTAWRRPAGRPRGTSEQADRAYLPVAVLAEGGRGGR